MFFNDYQQKKQYQNKINTSLKTLTKYLTYLAVFSSAVEIL